MRYIEPFGWEADSDYIDADPSTGVEGAIIPAKAVGHPQREIVHTIEKNQLSPNEGDLYQLAKAQQIDLVNWAVDIGTENNIVINLDPAPETLKAGLKVWVLAAATNTGAVDVNCNGF